jgi:uncharacterized protein YukE/sporulation protein YlmC with PRC-barrel domain
MSNKIHMETEQVRDLASRLNYMVENMEAQVAYLSNCAYRLSAAWQSPQSVRYVSELRKNIRNLEGKVDQLRNFSLRVNREVDEWEQVAASFGWRFREVAQSPSIASGSATRRAEDNPPKNMQVLAKKVNELYTRDEFGNYSPIRVVQIGPNEYLVMMAGTVGGQGANNWNSALISGIGLKGDYFSQIKDVVLDLPEGAVVNFAGHSQGGMMGNQLAVDPDVLEHIKVKSVTTFGSPVNADPNPGVDYQRYSAVGDYVAVLDPDYVSRPWEFWSGLFDQKIVPMDMSSSPHSSYPNSPGLIDEPLPFVVQDWGTSTVYEPRPATGSIVIIDPKPSHIAYGGSGGGAW